MVDSLGDQCGSFARNRPYTQVPANALIMVTPITSNPVPS